MGVWEIGIRAWLQHLAYFGSWMSHVETPFEVLLKRVTLYLNPLYQKSKLRMLLKKRMKSLLCVCIWEMWIYVLVMNEYNVS